MGSCDIFLKCPLATGLLMLHEKDGIGSSICTWFVTQHKNTFLNVNFKRDPSKFTMTCKHETLFISNHLSPNFNEPGVNVKYCCYLSESVCSEKVLPSHSETQLNF